MSDGPSDVMTLAGPLADRDAFALAEWCPIERALELIGTRSAMVLLREAFLGARRFDDLVRRAGITEAIGSKRLSQLVDGGLLARSSYREPGKRSRHEYVLTDQGRALFPVLVALIQFGTGLRDPTSARLALNHADCGAEVVSRVQCAAGHDVGLTETTAHIAAGSAE